MQEQRNAVAAPWPTLDALLRVKEAVSNAHDELERLSWWARPIAEGEGYDLASFEELGRLTAFISGVRADATTMVALAEQLARARDAVSPGFAL